MDLPRVVKANLVRVSQGPLSLRVEVGNNMVGGTVVLLNGKRTEVDGENELPIAKDATALQFKTLHCVTHVQDTNPLSDTTAVTYYIINGGKEQDFPYTLKLSAGETIAQYLIDFTFI